MTLDNFRRIDMQINRANDYQLETQFAKEGDYNGRELVVKITNAGEVSNQTGVSLNLGWQHNDAGNSGLDPFTAVDASKGIFKITYPTEMLIAGDVTATIQVIENGKITLTRNFKITVEYSPIDEKAIVSENSFTVLQNALSTISRYDNKIASLELDKVSQSEFDSWVATLLDGGPSIFMNTLSELQTTYPNGAPGVALVRETDPAKIYVWNGSAWEDFGDYQGIEIKDGSVTIEKIANRSVTPWKISDTETNNLLDIDNVVAGKVQLGTGPFWVGDSETVDLSNLVECSIGEIFTISNVDSESAVYLYDAEGEPIQFISGIPRTSPASFTIPNVTNVKYFRVNMRTSIVPLHEFAIVRGTDIKNGVKHKINWLSIENDNLEGGIDISKIENVTLNNLINFDTVLENHFFNGISGEYTPYIGRSATEPIEVSKGETYKMSPTKSAVPVAYLDSYNKVVSSQGVPSGYSNTQPFVFTVPTGLDIKYMIVTLTTDSLPLNQQIVAKASGYDKPDNYTMQGLMIDYENVANKPTVVQGSTRFENKNLLVTGDSITEKNFRANKNWHDYLKDWLNLGNIYNDGKSGSGLVKNTGIVYRLPNWETNHGTESDVDMILLMGNMNDGTSTETGDWNWLYGENDIHKGDFTTIITDTNKADSMWYALRYTIETIIEKYPNTPFGYITSQPRSMDAVKTGIPREGYDTSCWGRTSWFDEWVDAIIEVCGHYSVPVLDLYHESNLRPWNDENNSRYFTAPGLAAPDGIHPNDEGQEVMAWKIMEFVKQYM